MIHEQAIIHETAKIDPSVEVGPWTIIGPEVEIGENTWIGPHVVICDRTKIGRNNRIFSFSSIGEAPQHLTYDGSTTSLEIGDHNTIREYCTLNRGAFDGGVTRIQDYNCFMAYSHVAHDCFIGSYNIFVNNASISGHVQVGNHAYLGGFSGVHQYCMIGSHSFISGAAMINKDVLPYVMVIGNPASIYGLNKVGLKRRGFGMQTLRYLDRAYRAIFREGKTTEEAQKVLANMKEKCPEVILLIEGLARSTRGIIR